jgi:hypothetical protein
MHAGCYSRVAGVVEFGFPESPHDGMLTRSKFAAWERGGGLELGGPLLNYGSLVTS